MLHLTKGVGSLQSIGSNIRAFRLQNGFTQEQLAEKLGVTFQAVSKWETNANTPDISLLPVIAAVLGVMIDDSFDDGLSRISGCNGLRFERSGA
jgi:transcriptional regulator with XRE-family HTH domain